MNQDDYHHNHPNSGSRHHQAAAGEAAVADNARDVEMGSVDKSTEATGSDVGSKEDPQVETSRPSLYKFLLLAKPELPLLLVSFILLILADVANQILPIIIARAYNILVDPSTDPSERSYEINFTMMLVFILTLVGSGMGWIRISIQGLAGERVVVARLRLGLYKSILSQDISFFDETKSGEIVSRLGSDATLLQGSLSQGIPELLSGLTRAIIDSI